MGGVKAFAAAALMVMLVGSSAVKGQTINMPCTTSMISSFTPCANMMTGSTNNGAVPSTTCCESLRSLANASVNCACLLLSANVPLQIPFISTLATALVQACNINALPAQCKASGSPLPSPGPAVLGRNRPRLGPIAASPLSPQGSEDVERTKATKLMTRRLAQDQDQAPAPAAVEPTATPRIRPVFTPPSPSSSANTSPFVFLLVSVSVMLATLF